MREIEFLLSASFKRINEDRKFWASLNGIKLEDETQETEEIGEERQADVDAHLEVAKKRILARKQNG